MEISLSGIKALGGCLILVSRKDYLFTGKTPSLFRHDLNGLHSKQSDRLTISMNAMHKIPSKFVPKKFALSSKVANTRGTSKCCVGRNPYNGYKYLCGATPNGVFLMQWYDPLNKFMLLKVCNIYEEAFNRHHIGDVRVWYL